MNEDQFDALLDDATQIYMVLDDGAAFRITVEVVQP